jgi:flagellar biosynthesis/type III secretory pathway chaperone
MTEPIFEELTELLAAERAAILSASYDGLAELEQRKTRLLADYLARPAEPARNQRLLEDSRRNAALFTAAMEGLASVITRLRELEDMRAGFNAYGSDGQSRPVAPEEGKLKRKL